MKKPDNPTAACAVLLVMAVATGTAWGDKVYTGDGAVLTGTIIQQADGVLTLKTDYAGEIAIETSKVVGVTTEAPMAAELETTDAAVGRIVYDPEQDRQQIGVDGATPPTSVSFDAIRYIWSPDAENPRVAAMEAEAKAAAGKWSFRGEGGITGQTGNTERINTNVRLDLLFKTNRERLNLYARQRYAREDGQRSANEIIGGAKLERDINERWFAFAGLELEHDEFERLDLRSTATVGVGHWVIREEMQELKVRAGAGYVHESYDDGTSDDDAILELGVNYLRQINDRCRFTHDTTYYPSLTSISDFRAVMENALEVSLNTARTVSLRGGIRNEYDAQPISDVKRLDTFYFLNAVIRLQ